MCSSLTLGFSRDSTTCMPLDMLCSRLRRCLTDLDSLSLLHSAMSAILSLVGSARDPAQANMLHKLTLDSNDSQALQLIVLARYLLGVPKLTLGKPQRSVGFCMPPQTDSVPLSQVSCFFYKVQVTCNTVVSKGVICKVSCSAVFAPILKSVCAVVQGETTLTVQMRTRHGLSRWR